MPTITEGNLVFTFPDDWKVIKYDDSDFYRNNIPTDIGMSAVDFILSRHPGFSDLILIEVKDFRGYTVINRKRQTSGELVNEVITKCLDSIAALYLASYNENIELRHFYQAELLMPSKVEIVLFMEEDVVNPLSKFEAENNKKRINDMQLKFGRLKSKLNISTRILNTTLLRLRDGWRAV